MVDERDKATGQAEPRADGSANQDQSPPRTKLRMVVLFGGIGAAAVALGIVVALVVVRPMTAGDRDGEQPTSVAVGEASHPDAQAAKHSGTSKNAARSQHGRGASSIYTIRDIVINPAGTGGTRFLSVSFGFELGTPELEAVFMAREAVIRDALITILSSKTVAQLTDPKEKEIIRYQIKKRVSDLIHSEGLAGVYYTDFVLQ